MEGDGEDANDEDGGCVVSVPLSCNFGSRDYLVTEFQFLVTRSCFWEGRDSCFYLVGPPGPWSGQIGRELGLMVSLSL